MTRYAVICTKEWKVLGFVHAVNANLALKLAKTMHGEDVVVVYDDF